MAFVRADHVRLFVDKLEDLRTDLVTMAASDAELFVDYGRSHGHSFSPFSNVNNLNC